MSARTWEDIAWTEPTHPSTRWYLNRARLLGHASEDLIPPNLRPGCTSLPEAFCLDPLACRIWWSMAE